MFGGVEKSRIINCWCSKIFVQTTHALYRIDDHDAAAVTVGKLSIDLSAD